MDIDQLVQDIFASLKKGRTIPKHPFRYVCLATENEGKPSQRMLVFRRIEGNIITLYTDSRTPKVTQLKNNPQASLLLFDPKKMLQIQLSGSVKVDTTFDKSIWNNLSPKAKEDYTAKKTPGKTIDSFEEIVFDTDENHFCKLYFEFTEIDYLAIGKPHHTRAKFNFENDIWKGSYVVP